MRSALPPHIAWPLAVVMLLLLGIGSAFAALYFATSDGGPSVVDDYYSQAAAWDSVAAVRGAVARMGWTVEIDVARREGARADVRVAFLDADDRPVDPGAVTLRTFRPQAAHAVETVPMTRVQAGRYGAAVRLDGRGLWDFEVAGTDPEFRHRVRREF